MLNVALECKKLCAGRCLLAVIYGIAAQFLLLTTYLLFVKFSFFHPIDWLFYTIEAIFSWRSWLCLLPLIGLVVIHGIVLGKTHLSENRFHSTRFAYIIKTAGRHTSLFCVHLAIGFLTAWMYARFLPPEYTYFYAKCEDGTDNYCLNARYTFIALNGIYTGIFYYVSERFRQPPIVEEFPLIQQARYNELRFKVSEILYRAVVKQTILPTLAYICGCFVVGGIFLSQVAEIFGLWLSPSYTVLDGFLMLYMFVISSQIISNLALMDFLMNTFLTEYMEYPVAGSVTANGDQTCLTLVDALAAEKTPIVQLLAAFDLSTLSSKGNWSRRQEVFALSIPGGHPYNWTALSQQCLTLINAFRDELKGSAERCRIEQKGGSAGRNPCFMGPTKIGSNAGEMANIILQRQYNETYGMRNMALRQPEMEQKSEAAATSRLDPCRRFNETLDGLGQRLDQCKQAFLSLPGKFVQAQISNATNVNISFLLTVINYLFATNETKRLAYLLTTRSPVIDWTIDGLAGLVEHSLLEDNYGVVQTDLPQIVRALLQLQSCLEQVTISFNVQSTSRPRMRCMALLSTVKRSLCKLAIVFGEYLPDLLSDPAEIRAMNAYAQLRQT